MATLMNGFRGDALRVIEALQRFQDDPEGLAQERRQYSESPPPYPSGDTTKPPSPAPPLSEADRRIQRQHDRLQSVPYWQYVNQRRKEKERIIEQIERRRERRKETLPYNRKLDLATNAEINIANNWIEQGIWNKNWTGYPFGRWKHEEPLEDETEAQPEQDPPFRALFRPASHQRRPSTPPKISEEQLAVREREAAASRPLPQFRYQISKEHKWLEDEFWHEEFTGLVDIDAVAYENIKNSWIEQKIWNPIWGDEPGTAWMHEEPEKDELDVCPAPEAVSTDETDVADDAEHALRPIFERGVLSLSPTQLSDGDRVSSNNSSASRGEDIPSPFNQHKTASSPTCVDIEITQTLAEPATRILRKVRSSRIKKLGRTKRPTTEASPTKMSQDSAGMKEVLMPITNTPTLQGMGPPIAEASLVVSKSVRRKRAVEVGLDALPRRSPRIKARSGTSKCTIYDRNDASASGRDLCRGQQRSTRAERRTNPDASANPRTPRGVLKNHSRRQATSEKGQLQPGPSRRGMRKPK